MINALATGDTAVPAGDVVAAHVEGVFRLPKLSTAVIAAGAAVHWDVSASQVIVASTATGDIENFTVSPDQHFQTHAALKRSKPDFVICRHSGTTATLAGRLGVPVLPIFYSNDGLGYEGLLTIGRAILRVLPRRRFYEDVAAHSSFPYQKWWLEETNPYALDTAEAAE